MADDPKPMTQHDEEKWMAWVALSGNPHVAMQAAEDNSNPTLVHCMGNIMWGAVTAEELPDPPPVEPPPDPPPPPPDAPTHQPA
jgi:hypothetical protein